MAIDGGAAGCRELFDRLAMPTPDGNRFLPWHRLIVDTYALQHPDPFCLSAVSLAAHLTGVGWILEHRGNAASGSDRIRRWLNSRPGLVKPPLPAAYGDVTIETVARADTAAEIADAVEAWARSAWAAYAPLHDVARDWIAQALAYRGHAR